MSKILMLIVLCALVCPTGCELKKEHHQEDSRFLVTSPVVMDTTIFHEYVGQIHSIQRIELRALEKGYLQKIFVDEGESVKKGQMLFQIMPVIYQAELGKAQAEANFAKIEFANTKSLADSNIVSQNELALAEAKLDKAHAELNLAKAHLGFTEIRAPFDGIMGHFHVRLGSMLEEGELLSTLSDNSKMWVYFNVPEAEYLNFISSTSLDSLPQVILQMANNKRFDNPGIIETIEADFNNENGNIAYRATFPNPKIILRHGETGNVLMPTYLKDALIIPQKATFEILDKKFVFVVNEEGVLKTKQITVGEEMPHLYEVTDGLSKNDKILLEGLRKVKNNQEIEYEFLDHKKVLAELNELHAE